MCLVRWCYVVCCCSVTSSPSAQAKCLYFAHCSVPPLAGRWCWRRCGGHPTARADWQWTTSVSLTGIAPVSIWQANTHTHTKKKNSPWQPSSMDSPSSVESFSCCLSLWYMCENFLSFKLLIRMLCGVRCISSSIHPYSGYKSLPAADSLRARTH